MLGVILPPWAHAGGTDELMKRLENNDCRNKMIHDMENGIPGWDNFVEFAGLDQIFVTSVKTEKNSDLIGKNLLEIGKIRGKDPYNATFDLLLEEENAVGMVDFYGLEEHVIKILKRPEQNICTDGLLTGKPHPRAYGSFPRVLGRYVREQKILTIEEAIFKMTKKAAISFGIKNRGVIGEGYFADILVIDLEEVIDKGTYVDPIQYPKGIDYVLINGNIVLENGNYHKVLAGEVIRKK